ncbi:hypothetical protein AAMO2058_001063300 [Amorphochlora amoebiformis]
MERSRKKSNQPSPKIRVGEKDRDYTYASDHFDALTLDPSIIEAYGIIGGTAESLTSRLTRRKVKKKFTKTSARIRETYGKPIKVASFGNMRSDDMDDLKFTVRQLKVENQTLLRQKNHLSVRVRRLEKVSKAKEKAINELLEFCAHNTSNSPHSRRLQTIKVTRAKLQSMELSMTQLQSELLDKDELLSKIRGKSNFSYLRDVEQKLKTVVKQNREMKKKVCESETNLKQLKELVFFQQQKLDDARRFKKRRELYAASHRGMLEEIQTLKKQLQSERETVKKLTLKRKAEESKAAGSSLEDIHHLKKQLILQCKRIKKLEEDLESSKNKSSDLKNKLRNRIALAEGLKRKIQNLESDTQRKRRPLSSRTHQNHKRKENSGYLPLSSRSSRKKSPPSSSRSSPISTPRFLSQNLFKPTITPRAKNSSPGASTKTDSAINRTSPELAKNNETRPRLAGNAEKEPELSGNGESGPKLAKSSETKSEIGKKRTEATNAKNSKTRASTGTEIEESTKEDENTFAIVVEPEQAESSPPLENVTQTLTLTVKTSKSEDKKTEARTSLLGGEELETSGDVRLEDIQKALEDLLDEGSEENLESSENISNLKPTSSGKKKEKSSSHSKPTQDYEIVKDNEIEGLDAVCAQIYCQMTLGGPHVLVKGVCTLCDITMHIENVSPTSVHPPNSKETYPFPLEEMKVESLAYCPYTLGSFHKLADSMNICTLCGYEVPVFEKKADLEAKGNGVREASEKIQGDSGNSRIIPENSGNFFQEENSGNVPSDSGKVLGEDSGKRVGEEDGEDSYGGEDWETEEGLFKTLNEPTNKPENDPKIQQNQPVTDKKVTETEQNDPKTKQKELETEKIESKVEQRNEFETEQNEPETEQNETETEQGEPETEQGEPETEQRKPETEQREPETEQGESETEQNNESENESEEATSDEDDYSGEAWAADEKPFETKSTKDMALPQINKIELNSTIQDSLGYSDSEFEEDMMETRGVDRKVPLTCRKEPEILDTSELVEGRENATMRGATQGGKGLKTVESEEDNDDYDEYANEEFEIEGEANTLDKPKLSPRPNESSAALKPAIPETSEDPYAQDYELDEVIGDDYGDEWA